MTDQETAAILCDLMKCYTLEQMDAMSDDELIIAIDAVKEFRQHEHLQPDGVAPWILQLQPTNRLDEGFHGVDEPCDHAQPIEDQARDYRYTDDPTYGQFNL